MSSERAPEPLLTEELDIVLPDFPDTDDAVMEIDATQIDLQETDEIEQAEAPQELHAADIRSVTIPQMSPLDIKTDRKIDRKIIKNPPKSKKASKIRKNHKSGWLVQVASINKKRKSTIKSLKNDLRKMGIPPITETVTVKKTTYVRIKSAIFRTKQQALAARAKINKKLKHKKIESILIFKK